MTAVPEGGALRFGHFELRSAQRQVLLHGVSAPMGARAFDVLLALVAHRGRIVSKLELLDTVWPDLVVEENNLQVQISSLRKLLGPGVIATIPGRGYQFTMAPDEPAVAPRPPVMTAPTGSQTIAPTIAPAPAQAAPMAAIYGRDADLPALQTLVTAHRLVTLAGAGGIGKTALAHALADRLQHHFLDGVCVVELAPLADAAHVISTVAGALEVTLGAGAPIEALADVLRQRRMLIVLDNCEHLVAEVARLASSLLRAAPQLHVLSTSQVPLRLAEEQLYRLATLALPKEATLASAQGAGAVMLFEARARAALPRFRLTDANVVAVVDICRQLDGVALAIELAAARLPLLGVDGLRARLGERLRLLKTQTRMKLPRHQTLREALEWSHGLLTPAERVVFRRLGAVSGSFGLEAAERIGSDAHIDAWSLLDHLGALVDKSLVVVTEAGIGAQAGASVHGGAPRYHLLETMRHFALERLEAAGEAATVRSHHLAFYLALAEEARPLLSGPQQGATLARLDLDRDNLVAAHASCQHAEDGARLGLRLVTALRRYWLNRGLMTLGHELGVQVLALPQAQARDRLRCEALFSTGWLCSYRTMFDQTQALLEESVAIGREIGALDVVANALLSLSNVALNRADLNFARGCAEEALALQRAHGNDPELLSATLTSLGEVERVEGRVEQARPLYEEALLHSRRRGDRLRTMIGLNNLAMVNVVAGRIEPALQMQAESLAIADELGSRRGRLVVMEVCAGMAAMQGQHALAAQLDGAAEAHTLQMGRHRDPADEAYLRPLLAHARQTLGPAGFDVAQAAGRALPYDDAVAELRQWLHSG